jgi:xanthine dehydrogenase large subunit
VPNTSATAASAGADLNGAAVVDACAQIRERLNVVAAEFFGCEAPLVTFEAGRISAEDRSTSFASICELAYRQRLALFAHGYYRTPDIHFDPAKGRGKPFHYFTFGAAVSEVEIDAFTGAYRLLRTDILQDAGDPLSPIVDRGQIEGGFLQGVGWLTIEELIWDDRGRVATGGASTYKLPSWSEMPEIFNVQFLERATQPSVVFGSKAVGEPPLMLAISVREALRDAVAAFGPGEIVTFPSPATPERVFFAVRQVRAAQALLKEPRQGPGNGSPEGLAGVGPQAVIKDD